MQTLAIDIVSIDLFDIWMPTTLWPLQMLSHFNHFISNRRKKCHMNLCWCQCIAVCRTERCRASEEHFTAQSAAAACCRHAQICNALGYLLNVAKPPARERTCCDATDCKEPSDKSLRWISCDVCGRWLHFACVGLTTAPRGSYICVVCTVQGPVRLICVCHCASAPMLTTVDVRVCSV